MERFVLCRSLCLAAMDSRRGLTNIGIKLTASGKGLSFTYRSLGERERPDGLLQIGEAWAAAQCLLCVLEQIRYSLDQIQWQSDEKVLGVRYFLNWRR
jgi:hypothetical protein